MTTKFNSSIDVDAKETIINVLNEFLACAADLKMQVKNAHWNVKGKQFYQLHLLFDEIAGHFDGYADTIAERIAQLGGVANGTIQAAAKNTQVPEYDTNTFDGMDVVRVLVKSVAYFANAVRNAIDLTNEDEYHDMDTSDIFIEISRQTDKDLWFLESHLN